jgi:tRNA G18 (ribose-2'-O)-methylase SpoU
MATETVDHLEDPRVSSYAHVGDHEWLAAHGLFVAEGRFVVRRLLEERRFSIHSLLLTPPAHAALADLLSDDRAPVYVCSQQVLNALTGFDFHRGCLALAERGHASVPIESLLALQVVLGLEGVANPDNVGGIFRNALALGAGGVVLDPTSGDPFYRKSIRTSMGAVLRVPFTRMDNFPAGLRQFREAGFTIVALTPAEDAIDIRSFASSRAAGPLMLLAGHEGRGLTGAALAASDVRCRIAVDPRSDSLNVAVAVGIALAMLTTERTDQS